MRSMLNLVWIVGACLAIATGQSSGVADGAAEKLYVAEDGQIHIVSGGRDLVAPKEVDQASCASPKVAEDGTTAGWLVEFDTYGQSYPIPLELVIYREGRVVQRFKPGQSIWDWQSENGGKQVAFRIGPTHGDFESHFELRDVSNGRLRAQWDGHLGQKRPLWVSGLKE